MLTVRNFASNLKRARKNAGKTQEELGEKSGLKGSWIGHFEGGTRLPSLRNFCAICHALNIQPEELLQ